MSGAAKMHPTSVLIIDGKKTRTFKVTSETGQGLLMLLENLEINERADEYIAAEDIFPELKDPAKRIGILFRSIRTKFQLTQEQLAKRLGIDQSDVSKVEKGKRPIGKALAKKIQKEFRIDYRKFL